MADGAATEVKSTPLKSSNPYQADLVSASDHESLNLGPIASRCEYRKRQAILARPQDNLANLSLASLEAVQGATLGQHKAFEVAEAIEYHFHDFAIVFNNVVARVQNLNRSTVRRWRNRIRVAT
jgi:hypothetical protein